MSDILSAIQEICGHGIPQYRRKQDPRGKRGKFSARLHPERKSDSRRRAPQGAGAGRGAQGEPSGGPGGAGRAQDLRDPRDPEAPGHGGAPPQRLRGCEQAGPGPALFGAGNIYYLHILNRYKRKENNKVFDDKKREHEESVMRTNNRIEYYEEIKELKELLDKGAITQEEYDAKKTEILNRK